ncbi:hypothetical protein [Microlunatus flavus]|uniref:Uncharacterized protein n=1 Tax=Microlunatus flavus TaxID=1036181 RepID=A0A1H9FSR4_9ACTN|nr:hypothetical protein [Microlunatus flavus]SEQ40779.1 hypothetical protein SAMN05421756_103365 [Microlunatus flavus]
MPLNDVPGRAADLVGGPRGRQACFEVARLVDPQLLTAGDATDEVGRTRLVEQLVGIDVRAIAALHDPLSLVDVLATSVDSARYWQEPYEHDAVLADPRLVGQLHRVARALASAPAAGWWWSPADLTRQSVVRWDHRRGRTAKPPLRGAAARLEKWRDDTLAEEARAIVERPDDPTASWTGRWWSTPTHAGLVTTSRQLGRLPAVQLELVEDGMGWEEAHVADVRPTADARVHEIATPSDWAALVTSHPLDVDRSRRHDWYRTTGSTGPWQIPDWAAVSRDHDAVHLTVAGYLAAAGRALPTEHGWTVLAGFDPDLTYWLTDSVDSVGTFAPWTRTTDDQGLGVWVRDTTH